MLTLALLPWFCRWTAEVAWRNAGRRSTHRSVAGVRLAASAPGAAVAAVAWQMHRDNDGAQGWHQLRVALVIAAVVWLAGYLWAGARWELALAPVVLAGAATIVVIDAVVTVSFLFFFAFLPGLAVMLVLAIVRPPTERADRPADLADAAVR